MRLHRHQIEAQVPPTRTLTDDGKPLATPRPQIRRQLERICELLGIEYDDLAELYIVPGRATVTLYKRDQDGRFYRDQFNKVAMEQKRFPIDTIAFIGDEGDI